MATQTIGIIVNGATGRIGSTQHLANALVPIINEGGLPLGDDRLIPRLLLVGRDGDRVLPRSRAPTASRNGPPISMPRSSSPAWTIFFDAAATQQRVAVLAKALAAGKHVYSEKPVAPTAALGLTLLREAAARGRKHGAVEDKVHLPGLQKLAALTRGVARSGASSDSGSSSAGGCSTAATGRAQRPSWNYRAGGGGLILDMYPHWRYVIETIIGRIVRVASAEWIATPERIDEQGARYPVAVEDSATTMVELEGGVFGTILSSWATRVRRDDLLTLQVDGTKGSAVAGSASMSRAVRGADAGDCTFQRHEGHQRRLSQRMGRRPAARRPIAIRTASGGSSSCATSRADAPLASDFAAGIRDVAFAEACHRSMTERTWIAFPPPGKVP